MSTANTMLLSQVIEQKKHDYSIEALNLSNCHVGNTALSFLLNGLSKSEALESLDLSHNTIDSAGAERLANTLNSIEEGKCSLKTLNMEGNTAVEADAKEKLIQAAARHGIELSI